jgi:hypothetical protein
MPDYIPGSDAEFDAWLENYTNNLSKEKTNLKLSDTDVDELTQAKADWAAKSADYDAKHSAAQAATQAKKEARQRVEAVVRRHVRLLQADANVSNATRAALGLNVSDTTRTAAAAPTTRPVAQVDTSQRLRHTINFFDESTPNTRRKPDGVRGCEIWVKVGDPAPTSADQLRFLALDTATPYTVEYDGTDAGKTAHYWQRWISNRGEPGPWSQPVSATITS